MRNFKILFILTLLGVASCNQCKDEGKENIQIGISEEIDSLIIITNIPFSIIDRGDAGYLYSTSFIDISEDSLRVEVYMDSVRTTFDFEIVPDALHDIFIADSSMAACLNEELYDLETKNNVNVCYLARFLECD